MKKILLIGTFIIAFFLLFEINISPRFRVGNTTLPDPSLSNVETSDVPKSMLSTVAPDEGKKLSVKWNDFGKQLVDSYV